MKYVARFIGRFGLYILAFLIAAGAAVIGLKVNGIAPFGPHSILRLDMNQQYAPFLVFLKRNFGDWTNFLYSNNMTLGGNTFGLATYYLLSPFNFILLFFSLPKLPLAVAWIVVAKNGAAAVTMLALVRYFVRRYKLEVTIPLQLLLAISWGLSGWMLHYSMDIMWQDSVILLPLVVLGVEHYIEHTRWAFYAITLGLALILNYYMGYMIALFLVHYFILRMIVEWRIHGWHFKQIILKLGYFGAISLVTVGLAWVIIWPTLKTLQGVKGTTAYHFTLKPEWNLNLMFTNFFNLTYTGRSWIGLTPMIYTGVVIMVMLVVFFFANRLSGLVRFATGVTLVLLGFESYFQGTDVAWHGFTAPIGFTQRWAYVFGFLFILMALFGLAKFRRGPIATRLVLLVTWLVAIMFAFRQLKAYHAQTGITSSQFTELTFVYNVVAIAVTAVVLGLYFGLPKWRRWVAWLVAVVGVADLVVAVAWSYANQPPYFNMARYTREVTQMQAAVDWVHDHDQSGQFYRIGTNYNRSRNDDMTFGFDGLTHFSSSQPLQLGTMMQIFGYNHGVTWTNYTGGSTRETDSLFAVKYIIDGPKGVSNPGTKLVTRGLKKLKTLNGYTIYENPTVQRIGFVAATKTTKRQKLPYYAADNVNTQIVYQDLTGIKGDPPLRGGVKEIKRDMKTKTVSYSVPGEGLDHPLYTQVLSDKIYRQGSENSPKIDVYLNGKKISSTETEGENGVIPLGSWALNKRAILTFKVRDYGKIYRANFPRKLKHLPKALVMVTSEATIAKMQKKLASQPVNLTRHDTTNWSGTVTAKAAKQSLIMTLPYDEAWQIKVDGKTVTQHKYLQFMKINLKTPGTHRISLKYKFPELMQGLKVSLVSAVGLAVLLVIQAFTVWGFRIHNRRLERIARANAPLFDPHYFDYH